MTEPKWLRQAVIEAIHDRQMAEHGGLQGLRDRALLESALARPLNMFGHDQRDTCALGAAYAQGLVRNHPFLDGNKRTAFVAAYVFLHINGLRLTADEVDAAQQMLALASGDLSEARFADWLRRNSLPI